MFTPLRGKIVLRQTREDICSLEVVAAIRLLKKNTPPGIDKLPPTLFKLFLKCDAIIVLLTELYNKVFHHGNLPASWAVEYIRPIFKRGDKNNPNNY